MQQHTVPPEPFPHSMEPQLRKLGLGSAGLKLERGIPSLESEWVICEEGKVLSAEQVRSISFLLAAPLPLVEVFVEMRMMIADFIVVAIIEVIGREARHV